MITCIYAYNIQRKHTGKYTSSIIGFFSGMGDAAKEFGVPEGGCEGVSGFLFCVSLLFIVIIRSKTYAPDSPLVQLTFSKDGGSDGVNTEVRWSYCDLCIQYFVEKKSSHLCGQSVLLLFCSKGVGDPYVVSWGGGELT